MTEQILNFKKMFLEEYFKTIRVVQKTEKVNKIDEEHFIKKITIIFLQETVVSRFTCHFTSRFLCNLIIPPKRWTKKMGC